MKREPTPTPEPRTAKPALFKEPEQEAIQLLAFDYEKQDRFTRKRKPPLDHEDVSPENLKKARAVVAAFKQALAKRKAKTKPSDAEPGLPRNPAFGYVRFGGPYLKRP